MQKETLADRVKSYQIYSPYIAKKARPGQFVILRLSESGERVPLTIVDHNAETGTIRLIVQTVGKSTTLMDEIPVGETLHDMLGPLGNPSDIQHFGKVCVVGGGVGAAVAYPVARALKQAGNEVTSIIGARNKDLLILKDELTAVSDHLYFTTDDGSFGYNGFVTGKLQDLLDSGHTFDHVLAIGPLFMMRAISDLTRKYAIPTTVSLNTIMVDGTGMCGGCRVQVGDKTKFTCVDGPEFDGHLVDYTSIIQRTRAYKDDEDCRLDAQIEDLDDEALLESVAVLEKQRQRMPELSIDSRIRCFEEVALGFTEEQALAEAERCLQCRNPRCVVGCPVSVQIPDFIRLLKENKYVEAGLKIKQDNSLPMVCGRVCPQTDQCEGSCILQKKGEPIAIGALERFAADRLAESGLTSQKPEKAEKAPKAALIGSGPASLSCAGDLVKAGVEVTVFEAMHDFGGVLRYGIPEFRLPKTIVSKEVNDLKDLGVHFVPNTLIGATFTIKELLEDYGFDGIFIGSGAGLPHFLGIPGENLVGIYSSNDFLTRINLMKAYQYPFVDTPIHNLHGKIVGVFGGGNTALDSARVALRLGAKETYIIYRRGQEEMPGRKEEIDHAIAEGVQFLYLSNPLEFIGDSDGNLTTVRMQKMELGEPDASNRRRPIPIPGSEFNHPIDIAVIAIGNGSNPIIHKSTPDIEVNKWGNIVVDEKTNATSLPGVFAGGDIVTGGATVILAMGAGRKAAAAMLAHFRTLGYDL
ncbi:MAG: NADPH-dependent glutamate synthase [Anaerolineaceae bacterium]